jgi:hypothetical protein
MADQGLHRQIDIFAMLDGGDYRPKEHTNAVRFVHVKTAKRTGSTVE